MTPPQNPSPFSAQSLAVAFAVAAGLVWTQFSGDAARMIAPEGVAGIPYGRSILASFSDVVVLAALICAAARIGPGRLGRLSGLNAPVIRPFVVLGVIFAAAAAVCVAVAPLADDLRTADVLWLGVGGPVTEEIVFRGLALGALIGIAGWRFLPAALAPAAVFGLAHAAQGNAPVDSAAIVAITGVGGLLFGWLFVRWGFNLWPAIFAHAGMNALWVVFALGETAIGGWFGNGLRLALVALIILSAVWLAPAGSPRRLSGQPQGA
ncbi:MAG: CPBP family intramembrane metalloprotease [Alphaproteobacteria bacterium]|nr:CPBP family intramembrane metalloprotease [Alphaproteobacteria bacterium]